AIDAWLSHARTDNPVIAAVDRDAEVPRRWYVRLRGEEKDVTTVWFTLGQRTLRYETYVMPAPEENHAEVYEHLLRRNETLLGAGGRAGRRGAARGAPPDPPRRLPRRRRGGRSAGGHDRRRPGRQAGGHPGGGGRRRPGRGHAGAVDRRRRAHRHHRSGRGRR